MRKKTLANFSIFLGAGILVSAASFFVFIKVDFGDNLFKYFLPSERNARAALLPCLTPQVNHKCLSETLPGLFQTYGVAAVMKAFENSVGKIGETFALHEAAHRLGEAVYIFEGKDLRKALGLCTTAAHSGCQHAVLGAASLQGGIPLREVKGLAELCAETSSSVGAYSLCLHGLGHSFLVDRDGEVPLALADCDSLHLGSGELHGCYTGVFMENKTNIMGGGGKYLSSGDPLFPCTMESMDEKYLRGCYEQLNLSRANAFEICRSAPQKWLWACVNGIGITIASLNPSSPDLIMERCNNGAELKNYCLRGAVNYLRLADNQDRLYEKLTDEEKEKLQ